MEQKYRPYFVLPYDKNWVKQYKRERKIISVIFKKKALSIEHIGSTSVKGMWAKPQIDILITVKKLGDVNSLIKKMRFNSYLYHKNFVKNERYFTRDALSGERLISIHILKKNNPKTLSYIYFRDYLREHPKAKKLYSTAKRKAYGQGVRRADYPKRKRGTLKILLKKAKEWYYKKRKSSSKKP